MAKMQPIDSTTLQHARELRGAMTRHEQVLWAHLRRRQLGGLRFRRQRPIPPFVADFCCLEHRLVVELDGSQHGNEGQQAHDVARTEALRQQGYRVLRFSNWDVDRQLAGVLRTIAAACGVDLDEPSGAVG